MTDQEQARERAARELARQLHAVAPEGLLTDIDEFAAKFIAGMTTPNRRGRWCYVHANPGITPSAAHPDAYERGGAEARALLGIPARKDPTDA